jgi:hypothetical protein
MMKRKGGKWSWDYILRDETNPNVGRVTKEQKLNNRAKRTYY